MDSPVVAITGASRGIGKRLSLDFARNGYDVACLAKSTPDAPGKLPGTVHETADMVKEIGQRALPLACDVSKEEDILAARDAIYNEFGRCDVLINNAAIAIKGKQLEIPSKHWLLAVNINLNGPYLMMYHFCPSMIKAGEGRVINISSAASIAPEFGRLSYSVTKAGLEVLTRGMAHEMKDDNIAVNCIRLERSVWSDGYVATLGNSDTSRFEHPIVMSDAALWFARQPLDYTGQVLDLKQLRELGAVRPRTRVDQFEEEKEPAAGAFA